VEISKIQTNRAMSKCEQTSLDMTESWDCEE